MEFTSIVLLYSSWELKFAWLLGLGFQWNVEMGNETNRIFTGLGPKQILKVNSGVHLTVVSAFPALGKCKYYVGSIKKQ